MRRPEGLIEFGRSSVPLVEAFFRCRVELADPSVFGPSSCCPFDLSEEPRLRLSLEPLDLCSIVEVEDDESDDHSLIELEGDMLEESLVADMKCAER